MKSPICLAMLGVTLLATVDAQAANVVAERSRKWPDRTVAYIVCDAAGVRRWGRDVCDDQTPRKTDKTKPRSARLAARETETLRTAVDVWNVQFRDSLQFVEAASLDRPTIVFRASSRSTRCSTQGIGYTRKQALKYVSIGSRCNSKLSPEGTSVGSVLHEMMHAVGVYHEQQRFDRGRVIRVDGDNARVARKAHQWAAICDARRERCSRREPTAKSVGRYDLASIMHYSLDTGAKADGVRLTRRGERQLRHQGLAATDIGQRSALSETDVRAVRVLYPPRRLRKQPGEADS